MLLFIRYRRPSRIYRYRLIYRYAIYWHTPFLQHAQRVITVHTFVSSQRDTISEWYSLESAPLFFSASYQLFHLSSVILFLTMLGAPTKRKTSARAWTFPLYRWKRKSTTAHLNLSCDNNRDYGNRENMAEVFHTVNKRRAQSSGSDSNF